MFWIIFVSDNKQHSILKWNWNIWSWLNLCMLGNFFMFLMFLADFSKSTFSKNSFGNYHGINGLDPDQDQCSVVPRSKLLAKVISRWRNSPLARKEFLICLFDLIFLHPCQQDGSSWVEPVLSRGWNVLFKDTTQSLLWGSNLQPLNLKSSTLPLSHRSPYKERVKICLATTYRWTVCLNSDICW